LRIFFLCLLTIALSGCLYYGDIHGNSKKLNPCKLSVHHHYEKPACGKTYIGWWNQFHDPELNRLITVALEDSPTMQTAEARIRDALHLAEETAASLTWPQVDLSGYLQRQHFPEFGLAPPPFNGLTFNIGEIGFNFNYDFDFWGKNRETLRATINEERATVAELANARLVLSAAVASTYFQLCNENSQIKIALKRWKINKELFDISTARAKRDIYSAIPVKTAESNAENAKQILETHRQTAELLQHELALLLGKNALTTTIDTHCTLRPYFVKLPACLPAHLLAARPDIQAAKLRTEAAANRICVSKARFFPDINLVGLLSYQSVKLNRLFSSVSYNNAITGAFDLPIFDAGARRANLKEKYAEYDIAVGQYNQTILQALRDVADQLTLLKSIRRQLSAQLISKNAISHNYQLTLSRYHNGITDDIVVMQNKELLLQQEALLLNLQTSQAQSMVALLKALGGNDGC